MGDQGNAQPSDHLTRSDKRQSILVRDRVYRKTCKDWYVPGRSNRYSTAWQAHHVACDHALSGREIDAKNQEYVEQCLWITKWNLNDRDNLVGLPMWRQYYLVSNSKEFYRVPNPDYGKTKTARLTVAKLKSAVWSSTDKPSNYPAHDVDHNGVTGNYTDEVKKWLKDQLWDTLVAGKKPHSVEAKRIEKTLKTCTFWFKLMLKTRGMRWGGTQKCWDERFKSTMSAKWFLPFSMSASPTLRHPGFEDNSLDRLFNDIRIK